MNINDVFPGNYLKAADLDGRQVVGTIDRVEIEKIGDDNKAVLYFQNKEKGIVLNVTNKNMLIEITQSEETDTWRGTRVKLFSTKVDFKGQLVDGLRIDYAAARPVLTDDDVPF